MSTGSNPDHDPEERRPPNTVHVSLQRSKFVYVDLTKHILSKGHDVVHVSALGTAINAAVSVVEVLKAQNMVQVTKIETGHTRINLHVPKDMITISLVKSREFDDLYRYSQEQRHSDRRSESRSATPPNEEDPPESGNTEEDDYEPEEAGPIRRA